MPHIAIMNHQTECDSEYLCTNVYDSLYFITQILISKFQASGGVVVSVGWGNGSGWQWNIK